MSRRFFVETPIQTDTAELVTTEAQHASKVMRCRVGDDVVLFDNSGAEFKAQITQIDRSTVQLRILDHQIVDRELVSALTLGVALPKGDRQRWLVEKAVELGVAKLVPMITERGVAQPGAKAIERLRRTVVEASKQCGRNRLMQISPPMTVAEFCASMPQANHKLLATPQGQPWPETLAANDTIAACIGPEGGLTPDEQQAAMTLQWTPVGLGKRILRIETAAIAIASTVAIMTES